jgi:hypothetical protein
MREMALRGTAGNAGFSSPKEFEKACCWQRVRGLTKQVKDERGYGVLPYASASNSPKKDERSGMLDQQAECGTGGIGLPRIRIA